MAGTIQYGEQGAPYVSEPGKEEEVSAKRRYLSKDGKKDSIRGVPTRRSPPAPVIPADIWESSNRKNRFGGGPPPGYGAHFEEDGLWETPVFQEHPITKKQEAINGIFFRLWPRHVRVLQIMKLVGWPHVEIVAVAKELRRRQVDEYQREAQLIQQYIEAAHQEALKEASSVGEGVPLGGGVPGEPSLPQGGIVPPEGAMPPEGSLPPEGAISPEGPLPPEGTMSPEGGEMMFRSLSMSNGMDYNSQLESYRGKFYNKDGGPANIFVRAQRLKEEASRNYQRLSKTNTVSKDSSETPHGFSFGVIVKAEAGFEPELSQVQLKREEEKDWSRKKPGILGGSLTKDED